MALEEDILYDGRNILEITHMTDDLFHCLKPGGDQQVICFPYLGGHANSFAELTHAMDQRTEVWAANLPGHGGSVGELVETIDHFLQLYDNAIKSIIKPNCIFLGHSMGGIVAYFLAQKIIHSECTTKPKMLILSACNTPESFVGTHYSSFSKDKLLEYLLSFGGVAEEFSLEKDLLEYFLPIYRADFKILESAAQVGYHPLDIPAYFLWGENDKIVSMDAVIQWSQYFTKELHLIPIKDGSHMFIHQQASDVAKIIRKIVS